MSKKSSRKKKKQDDSSKEEQKGNGTFVLDKDTNYTGDWILVKISKDESKKVREGKGIYKEGGNKYEGEFKNDFYHGKGKTETILTYFEITGKMEFMTNDVYEGEFFENKFHGKGTFVWADGSKYVGNWKENKMHDTHAMYINKEGKVFHGEFYNGIGKELKREIEG